MVSVFELSINLINTLHKRIKQRLTTILLFLITLSCLGQKNYPTSNETNIFSQPDVKITKKTI